jgi:hypothetical protein
MKRHLSTIVASAALAVLFLMVFAANARAAAAVLPTDTTSIFDLLRPVYDAFAGGHAVAGGALALVAVVALLKRYSSYLGATADAFLHSDVGGALTTTSLAFFGAVGVATANSSLSWSVLSTAGGIAVAAVGGYTLLKRLVLDRLQASSWYATKAPAWLKLAVSLIDPPSAIATAEKAGSAAVQASPAAGAGGVAGQSTKF